MGDIHNQLYLPFHSLLEEIHNVYTHQDLVRVYITHDEMVKSKYYNWTKLFGSYYS